MPFHQISWGSRTWDSLKAYYMALGRCVTACTSKHVVSAWWRTTSFFSCDPRSSGPMIWATVDRSWGQVSWPARSLELNPLEYYLWGSHKILELRDLCVIQGRPIGAGYGCGVCLRTRISDRLYQNMVRRYRICWRRWSSHRALLVSGSKRQAAGVRERKVCCDILRVAGK